MNDEQNRRVQRRAADLILQSRALVESGHAAPGRSVLDVLGGLVRDVRAGADFEESCARCLAYGLVRGMEEEAARGGADANDVNAALTRAYDAGFAAGSGLKL